SRTAAPTRRCRSPEPAGKPVPAPVPSPRSASAKERTMTTNIFDAQAALGFVVSQTSHIEREVNETTYPDIQYPGLIPVDTSGRRVAKSVTYCSSDKFGAAGWING